MGKESEEMTAVLVSLKRAFLDAINDAIQKNNLGDRSSFIRAAIVEKMKRMGIDVDDDLIRVPSRIGKGGRPTHKKRVPSHPEKKDTPSNKPPSEKKISSKVASVADQLNQKLFETVPNPARKPSGKGLESTARKSSPAPEVPERSTPPPSG